MKIEYTSPSGRIKATIEANAIKDGVNKLRTLQCLLDEERCRQCDSQDIKYTYRSAKGYEFIGLKCESCGGTCDFHEHKKDSGGGYYINRSEGKQGWLPKYSRADGDSSQRNEPRNEEKPQYSESEVPF